MVPYRKSQEEEDAELLEADAAHVDVDAEQCLFEVTIPAGNNSTCRLDEKREDVEQDKVKSESPCFYFKHGC